MLSTTLKKAHIVNIQKKILIIRLDRLSDLVLFLPAFASLRKNFPKAGITALVKRLLGEMLTAQGFADKTKEFDAEKSKGIGKKIRFLLRLSKRKFDFAIDLRHAKNAFSVLALFFANAKIKAGYTIGLRGITAKKAICLA